jgi:Flp pilus assembly protein TadG
VIARAAGTGAAARRERRRGAILLEAAIVLPLMLLLVFGLVEFGYFFHVKHTMAGAARNGARAAIRPTATNADVTTAVQQMMTAGGISTDKYTVAIEDTSGTAVTLTSVAAGTNVAVRVQATWGAVGVRPMSLISSTRVVSGTVVMMKEGPGA